MTILHARSRHTPLFGRPAGRRLLVGLLLAGLLGIAAPAQAQLVVTKTADTDDGECVTDCSLREAIDVATTSQTITFAPALDGQTITLGGSQLLIDKNLTIDTEGQAVTVDANHDSRVFQIGATISSNREVTLRGLTITGGDGVQDGGGILVVLSNTLHLEGAMVTGNTANDGNPGTGDDGGGISVIGTLFVTNSTISGNTAFVGGGISAFSATVTVTASTITDNTASQGGGVFFEGHVTGSFTLSSSLVAGNTATSSDADCSLGAGGSFTSSGQNLFGSVSNCPSGTGDQVVDPADVFTTVLSPTLSGNGGPSATHLLLPGSPALDTGACNGLMADQRGFPRPVDISYATDDGGDACDVGAVEATEAEAALPTVTIDDPTVAEPDGTASFTVTLSHLSGLPVLVDYTTNDGTATAGDDYTAAADQLTIPASTLTGTIDVAVVNDTVDEDDETFTVTLSNPTNATLDDDEGTATIEDDDTTDLSLAKDDGDATAIPGAVIPYTLTATNNGTNPAPGVVLNETVPDHTTFDAASSTPGWTCADGDPAGTNCTLDLGTLAVSASDAATFAVAVVNPLPAGVTETSNTATVNDDGSNGDDATPDDNTATDTTPLDATPDLALTKDDGGLTALPGQAIPYTLTVTNNGDQDATGVVLSETVPAHTTFDAATSDAGWTCADGDPAGTGCIFDLGALAGGGGTAPVVFAVVVDKPLAAGVTEIDNTASVADDGANGDDANPDDNAASDTTPVTASALVSATLDDALAADLDGDGTADPGETLAYTATVSNTGDQDAADVVYTQTVDANTSLVCASVNVSQGAVIACTDGPGGALTVELTTVAGEQTLFKAQATATISFAASVNVPLPVTVTALSTQGTVAFTGEDGPAAVVTDDPATPPVGDATTTPVDQSADLALEKTVDDATPGYGATVVYTLRVTNDGPTTPASATVEDALPDGLVYVSHTGDGLFDPDTDTWSTPNIAFDATAEIEITARVETVDPATNTACLTGASLPDPDASNNCAAATITPVAADLALVKTLTGFTGEAATNLVTATFTLTVSNHGPSAATGVVVSDPLPEGATLVSATGAGSYSAATGLWSVGGLANGASASITLEMEADAAHNLLNLAEVTGDQPDPDESNNVAGAQGQHDNPSLDRFRADLSLEKTASTTMPSVGEEVTFTLVIANGGPSATAGVQVSDLIEPDSLFEVVSVETTGSATYADGVWTVGHLANGATATLTVTVRILGAGSITNTAEVVASTLPDPDSHLGNGATDEDDQARVTLTATAAQAGSQAAVREGPATEGSGATPQRYALGANYPNPLNPSTVIPYTLPEAARVRIAVYDLLGREVAVLVDREQASGRYGVRWQAVGVATGVYLVRMQAGSFVQVRRATVVK